MHIDYRVTGDNDNRRVAQILKHSLNFSRGEIRRLKRCAGVKVNNTTVRLDSLVRAGDLIHIAFQDDAGQPVLPQYLPLQIIFEDDHILVLNKPPALLVHPISHHLLDTLANGVIYHWQQQGLNLKFRAVSRLDKDTSGAILIAKNSYTCQQLAAQMQQGLCRREYLALVQHRLFPDTGVIDLPIGRPYDHSLIFGVTPAGKPAVTHYHVIKRFADSSLVKLRLETGRTHQIRVHLSHLGHPLLGDDLYGGSLEMIKRQTLHSWRLQFIHPVTKENIRLQAPLPTDLGTLIRRLNGSANG